MGNILQIRVMAYTFRPEDVVKAWPKLSMLAFGSEYVQEAENNNLPLNPLMQEGVLKLIDTLYQGVTYGTWVVVPLEDIKERVEALTPGVNHLMELKKELENYLANWQPKEANQITIKIEDALTDLEKIAPAWVAASASK